MFYSILAGLKIMSRGGEDLNILYIRFHNSFPKTHFWLAGLHSKSLILIVIGTPKSQATLVA